MRREAVWTIRLEIRTYPDLQPALPSPGTLLQCGIADATRKPAIDTFCSDGVNGPTLIIMRDGLVLQVIPADRADMAVGIGGRDPDPVS